MSGRAGTVHRVWIKGHWDVETLCCVWGEGWQTQTACEWCKRTMPQTRVPCPGSVTCVGGSWYGCPGVSSWNWSSRTKRQIALLLESAALFSLLKEAMIGGGGRCIHYSVHLRGLVSSDGKVCCSRGPTESSWPWVWAEDVWEDGNPVWNNNNKKKKQNWPGLGWDSSATWRVCVIPLWQKQCDVS